MNVRKFVISERHNLYHLVALQKTKLYTKAIRQQKEKLQRYHLRLFVNIFLVYKKRNFSCSIYHDLFSAGVRIFVHLYDPGYQPQS